VCATEENRYGRWPVAHQAGTAEAPGSRLANPRGQHLNGSQRAQFAANIQLTLGIVIAPYLYNVVAVKYLYKKNDF
jgi:hypothetical protein